jgi:quercetin dioxygenase-like cupin family protein
MRRLVALLAVGATAVAGAVAVAQGHGRATAPVGVHLIPLSHATFGSSVHADGAGVDFRTRGPKQALVTSITVDPGGTFGWHSHPGPVLVMVAKGTLAEFHAEGHRCPRTTVTAGHAFVESGGEVHLARNAGSTPVELNATFLAQPGTTEFVIPEQQPRVCHV